MDNKEPYDAGNLSLVEMIRVLMEIAGPAFTQGALTRTGIGIARGVDERRYATLEDFVASIEEMENPIARFEGKARHYGEGVFGLPECPYARSHSMYREMAEETPPEHLLVTRQINKPSEQTHRLKMGEGAAVGPLCAVHHALRSAAGEKIRIGDHRLEVYKLACKSSRGERGFAMPYIEELGVDVELVRRVLDENACCYALRLVHDAGGVKIHK